MTSRQLPAKLYYRIGEVAGIVGVEPHVLRYWETEFRSVRPQKSAKGQRVYTRRDVETLLKVKELLYSHRFTIAGARRKLREGGFEPAAEAAPPRPPEGGEVNREEAQRMRETLLALRADILALLTELEDNELPSRGLEAAEAAERASLGSPAVERAPAAERASLRNERT